MSRAVDGLQGERREEDLGQRHGHDHGRGQEPNPFWSEEVREEHLLTQARPRGLPDETPSANLLDLDLDEDELRTAGESTPSSWEPLKNQGGYQSDAIGWPSCDQRDFKEFRRWGPTGFQAAVTTEGCQHGTTWRNFKDVLDKNGNLDKFKALRRNNSMDFKPAMDKYGVLDTFKALRWNNSMGVEPTMEENGILDKFKVLRRITLMDFKAAVVEHEVLNKFKDLDKSYLQQKFNVLTMSMMSWSKTGKETG